MLNRCTKPGNPAITIGCGPLSSGYQFTIDGLQFIRSALRHGIAGNLAKHHSKLVDGSRSFVRPISIPVITRFLPLISRQSSTAQDGRGEPSTRSESNMAEGKASLSGLSEAEAKEFHGIFVTSFVVFTGIAAAAHVLAWMWRPWLRA